MLSLPFTSVRVDADPTDRVSIARRNAYRAWTNESNVQTQQFHDFINFVQGSVDASQSGIEACGMREHDVLALGHATRGERQPDLIGKGRVSGSYI